MDKIRFCDIVREYVECIGDVEENLVDFFHTDYTMIKLKGSGILGYSEHKEYFFIWFTHIDNKVSNAKIVYNTVKSLSKVKPVLYSGTRDYYGNNSVKLEDGLYQIQFKR